jgi:hypothetical protein|nr:MAG TPA: ParB ddrB-like ParB superfamily domain [Caudoviricetes sp.]
MENLTKTSTYGIDPNQADKSLFDRTIDAIPAIKEKGGDENLRMGAVLNAICAIDPTYNAMSPDMAFMSFFGHGTTLDDAEKQLLNIREITRNADAHALSDFKNLSPEEQEKRIRANSSDAKTKKTVAGYMGIPTTVETDNPDFDLGKARQEYEADLAKKDTFKGFINLKNAGLSGEIIRDVMRFKTAFDTREEAAEAYVDKFLSTDNEDWARQFIIGINAFSPTLKRGFVERVNTRISEDFADRYFNAKDYLWGSNADGAVMFSMAQEMGLVDKNGDLTSDSEKLAKLKSTYEQKRGGSKPEWGMGGYLILEDIDVLKLFAEGKKRFERVKTIRGLMNASRTRFDYSDGEWKTFEEALINGATSLEYLGLTLAGSIATRNPLGGLALSSSVMYVDEASGMYADLRYDGNVNESSAANLSALYGIVASGLEQVQLKSLGRAFAGKGNMPSTFKEYIKQGFKGSVKNLLKEGGIQTFTELATSTDALATKLWAKSHENATFEERELWDEYREECSQIWKTMPLITLGFWGVGAPFRARGYLKNVGADFGSGLKGMVTPSKIIENNVQARGVILEAENYFEEVKDKFGKTALEREWLEKYQKATSEEERTKLLNERYSNDEERNDAALMLNNLARLDSEATKKWAESKIEVAKKVIAENRKIKDGDKTGGLSVLDEMEDSKYNILESAIDALDMREDVVFINNAQQLSEIFGLSIEEAESQMARVGAKGFFEDKSGKIAIISSHFKSGADALQTFTHEYGHKIMTKIRKTDLNGYNRMCDEVLSLVGGESLARATLPQSYSTEGTSQYISDSRAVAEEVLMRVVERVALKKVLDVRKKSVWARFKNWFSKLFDEKTFADMAEDKIAQIALNVLQREKSFNVQVSKETARKAPSKTWRAKTPEADGAEASGEYAVIDAFDLTASTDNGYDDALQPRNRSRQASKEQVSDIAIHLDPERLGDSPTTDLGAPIVDSRGMVVSGNGRILAIRQAYDGGKGEEYGNYVKGRASEMGIEIPANIKNPVLVRRVDNTGEMSLEEFAARSNKSQVAGMSIAEQAVADGRRILEANLLDTFFPDANGNVLAASNADFYNAFLNLIGGTEMYRNSDGSIRQNLTPRIRAAVLSAMLNPDKREVIERLLDNPEGYNALINGLMQCAANVAELTQKPQYDISDNLSEAVELYIEMHDKGQTVAEFEAQTDMFREPPSEETMFLCKLFEENQKTSSGISGVLKKYAEECRKIDTTTQSLFGDEDPSKLEKLRSAYDHYATDLATSAEESPKLTWRDVGDERSSAELDALNKKFRELYDAYKGGDIELTPEDRGFWAASFQGDDGELIKSADVPFKIYDIDEAYKFARKHLQGAKFRSKDNHLATLGRNALDKMNSGKARGKTANNKLHALSLANIGRIFGNSELLKTEKSRTDTNIKNSLRFYAPLYMDGQLYAVKITAKEFNDGTGESLYSIEGIDVNREPDQSGKPRDSIESSTSSLVSGSVDNFIGKLREVNKKIDARAIEAARQKAYQDAVELVAEEARRKGYDVKVYHGTGANGFNVALADASKSENGEGNQAHGMGLYMAVSRDTAEEYRYATPKEERFDITKNDKPFDLQKELGISENEVIFAEKAIDQILYKNDRMYADAESVIMSYMSELEENIENNEDVKESKKLKKAADYFYGYVIDNEINDLYEFYSRPVHGIGRVFDWVHNMKPDELLDEQKSFKEQNGKIKEKINYIIKDFPIFENLKSAVEENRSGGDIYDAIKEDILNADDEYMYQKGFGGHRNTVNNLLLDEGIRGITYDGRQDGRCFVSFEGGATVKLQDPFTFDDNGQLIPLSERFNDSKADMRWRDVGEQIKTPQFKAWFGNSQVVDKNGKPLHVYHGTNNTNMDYSHFEIFGKPEGRYKVNKSYFFSSNKDIAGSMGSIVYDVFLRIENPLIIEANGDYFSAVRDHTDGIVHYKDLTAEQRKALREVFDVNAKELKEDWGESEIDLVQAGVISRPEKTSDEWADYARTNGYDGVIFRNLRDGAGFAETQNPSDVFVVFEPNQIKDATGENNGDFSNENPSIKWRDDTVLMPVDINILVARNIDALMNAIRKSHKLVFAKKIELERKYPKKDNESKRKRGDELRQFILEKFSSELVPIAMLSDEDAKFYNEQFEVEDRFVYTSFGYAIEHYFNRHSDTPIEDYILLPDTIFNPDKKKEVGKWIKNELGDWFYDASQAFIKEYDKWHVSTIKVDTELTSSGKKLIAFKNFYDDDREPYRNKETIEYYWKAATPSSNYIRRQAKISTLNNLNRQVVSSKLDDIGQENSTRLKSLLRQERSENPVIWASIVLAREILLDRKITSAKLDKVLPPDKFDGTKREYAVERARQIAEQCKATQENYKERLDEAVQLAESDVYWNHEVMQEMYRSFRKDGEEYGIVKQKLLDWLKAERIKDLENVKGLSSEELGLDITDAIQNAMEAEPERKPSEETKELEEETEELDESEVEGIDEEILGAKEKLAPSTIRDIVSKVRVEVTKAVKKAGKDEATRRMVYRNTLVNVLKSAAKELAYGREREAIFAKINELSQKGYAVIKIKDGERAGQKIDNFTLRAEHIALRIFNRGVRDTKKALFEKFESAVRNVKTPKRIEREDKRKMAGKAELRAKSIKDIAEMTTEEIDADIERTMEAINKADSKAAEEFESKLVDAVQHLEDLQRFGAFRGKTRAEMAEAVEWIENFLEAETSTQQERVEKLKAAADSRRKIFLDAINEMARNANFDGKMRESLRVLFNSASTFKDLILGLGRAASGEKYKAFRSLVEDMMNDAYAATTRKENEIFRLQEEFSKVVCDIYGMSAHEAFKHILGTNAKLQKFSVQGKPMSVQIALQRLSMAEQENYQANVCQHCIAKTETVEKLESRILDLRETEEKTDADWEELKRLQAELADIYKKQAADYAESLRSALSEKDLKLLDWFRDFYKRERKPLSEANEVVTGLGIPEADPLYTPMKMLREGGTNEKIQVVAIVPKSLSPRVPNSFDMDESVGIVDIWNSRIAENAHYKAFSQLNIEWRGIFAHADFHKAVSGKFGKDVLNQILDHFNDIMSVKLLDGLKIEKLEQINGLYAIAALGFNLGSGLRQITGASAFANFIGIKDTLKYAKDSLSKEGRQAAVEILNSETAKRRMARGNNQALVEALRNIEDNRFWSWYKRNAMVFNRWGDILPIITIGQGLYRSKTAEYAKTMPIDKAKERAMNEMWAIAEASQQSPSIMNLGSWQRRGGSFGKAAGLFISSPQLMLSREIEAVNRFKEIRKKYKENPADAEIRSDYMEARNNLAKTVFINHVMVQGGYMVATLLWKSLLGDDWDDDDWYAILGETLAGPLGGLIVFGRFVSAFYSNYSVSAMPIEGFGRTIKGVADLIPDIIALDGEEIAKDLNKIAKSLFAPWRDVSKAYNNYSEN